VRETDRFAEKGRGRPLALAAAALLLPAAVLVAPAVHRLVEAAGLRFDFPQTLRRLLMVAGIGALLLAFRPWRDLPEDRWGLRGPRARPSHVAWGFALSVGLLLVLVLIEAATGRFTWDHDRGVRKFWSRLPASVLSFGLLAVVEETLFRGWLHDRLRARLRVGLAIAVGSAIFAALHAFRGSAAPDDLPATLAGAGEALAAWGRNLVDVNDFLPRFVGLVALGTLLCFARLRTGSLYLPIGIHLGAALFINLCSALTHRAPERDWMGSKWLYDGPPGWAAMALAALLLRPRASSPDPAPAR